MPDIWFDYAKELSNLIIFIISSGIVQLSLSLSRWFYRFLFPLGLIGLGPPLLGSVLFGQVTGRQGENLLFNYASLLTDQWSGIGVWSAVALLGLFAGSSECAMVWWEFRCGEIGACNGKQITTDTRDRVVMNCGGVWWLHGVVRFLEFWRIRDFLCYWRY